MATMEGKKTLLQKYEIPLHHLDFAYVKKCSDARELEKMVQILRSGEEGFFPDLTRSAEEKLRELKPDSKLFRYEEPIKRRHCLGSDEWKPIYDWTNEIKSKDNKLAVLKDQTARGSKDQPTSDLGLPPIRKTGKINESKLKSNADDDNTTASSQKKTERIKATDYRKWDKFDAEEEILKMELAEERVSEEVERKNRLNLQRSSAQQSKVAELTANDVEKEEQKLLNNLTDVEREQLAEEYRLRGNEYFRTKEYESAFAEYSRAIKMNATTAAPAYNNRAAANMKLHKYLEAIEDLDKCLQLEPHNVKAWLRKAEASYHYGRRRESYDMYQHVLQLDSGNKTALKAVEELRAQLGDLPPPHATRLQIQEEEQALKSEQKNTEKRQKLPSDKATKASQEVRPKPAAISKDYDLAQLVVPNRVIPSKLSAAAAALGKALQKPKPAESAANTTAAAAAAASASATPKQLALRSEPKLRLPACTNVPSTGGKPLIEEI